MFTDPDEISTKFLKEMAAPVTPALTFIFQASLNQGQTPEDWKLANVSHATPSTITLWVRPARKLLIQFKVGPRTP
jgi:hypothetical protein